MPDRMIGSDREIDFGTVLKRGKVAVSVTLSTEECQAMADTLGVIEVASAAAKFVLSGGGKARVGLSGNLSCTLVQRCVVTLAPVEETVETQVHREFIKVGTIIDPVEDSDLDPFDDDPPDVLEGDFIDLMSVITEVVALEMAPYPRSEVARTTAEASAPQTQDAHLKDPSNPFAALAQIKDRLR